jgi:1-phosphatidylinositol-4-phosphate 5-kinase
MVVSSLPPIHNEDNTPLSAASVEGPGIFYIGLIDMLQEWNWSKWIERMFKVYVLRKDELGISAVEPNYYRVRFMERAVIDVFDGLDKLPEVNDEEEEEDVLSSVSSRKDSERSSLQIDCSEIDNKQQGSQSPIHSNFV